MLSKSLFINYFETYSKTQLSSTCVSSSFDKIVILKFIWESDKVSPIDISLCSGLTQHQVSA